MNSDPDLTSSPDRGSSPALGGSQAVPVAGKNSAAPSGSPKSVAPVPLHHRYWFADACMLATTLIWGANIVIFKDAIGKMDPFVFNSVRLFFATLALGICVGVESRWRRKPFWPRSATRNPVPWFRVAVFSLLTGVVYIVFYLNGIIRTTAGNTALLLSSMPMWTAVLSYLFLHERLPRIAWIGFSITMAGTLIVTLFSAMEISLLDSSYFIGNLLMLIAAFSWATATVLNRSILRSSITPLQLTFIASVTTTPLHLLYVSPVLMQHIDDLCKPTMLAAVIFSGAFSTGLAYALWNTGVKILGGSHAAIFQNVVTVIAVVGGWVVLGEQPLVSQIVGGLVIIAGVLVMRRGRSSS